MKRPTTHSKKTVLLIAFLLCSFGIIAQTLNKPTPIKNPNFGSSGSPWTAACASASFNEYFVNFTWVAAPAINSDNTFILELSNASGDFTSPVNLATIADKNTVTDFNISFAIPTNTRGAGYKLRVKSTSPVLYSPVTAAYNMYYIDFKNPIQITENGSGNIGDGTISVCGGNSTILAVDNVPNAETYQYIWRKSSTILGEKSHQLTVTQTGMYSVEIDYGSVCSGSAGTLSNLITAEAGAILGVTINPPAETSYCLGDIVPALEATIADANIFYTWYKDGVEVKAATQGDYTYTINTNDSTFAGDYTVKVEGDGICTEITPVLNITKKGAFSVTVTNPLELVILPAKTKILNVTTTANSPIYQWYRNNIAIAGATSSSLTINQEGEYYVQLTQNTPCVTIENSEKTIAVSPVSFELITDYLTTYSDCQNTTIDLDVKTINAIDSSGGKTDVTADLKSSLTYQWKKDGVVIVSETSSSINLNDTNENGLYTLEGVLETFNLTSNSLNVTLRSNETVVINSSALVICNSIDPIVLNTTTNLTGATFSWLKDGVSIDSSSLEINANSPGKYQLQVTRNGCPIPSNEITISPLDESLITLDSPLNIILIEGSSKTITASGGTSYEWFDSSNNSLSNSASVSLTEEGTYTLIAYVDTCTLIKQITIAYKETFKIPNVITVNGDGINDLWLIPNTYSQKSDVNVIIYNNKGEEVYNVFDYQNNWPQSATSFPSQNMVFYYKIKKGSDTIKQGTITVIK